MRYGLQRLWNPNTKKGLLAVLRRGKEELVERRLKEADKFFAAVETGLRQDRRRART